jgi:hypothetical protein
MQSKCLRSKKLGATSLKVTQQRSSSSGTNRCITKAAMNNGTSLLMAFQIKQGSKRMSTLKATKCAHWEKEKKKRMGMIHGE